ncbi:uncharacterized protein C6orf136 homolog isoform X2 [Poeciliopsis prolifica]|uniref:uncharacterized protein C6orf136 homolog isoform X2 n=1 Tax=Poeciliopsis prolifica TaxID=188132 RepID=UPI002413F2A1|nr:uncharacterized protein C6orf136 homolog isoform X2 [Poeciliopsis prolifica]
MAVSRGGVALWMGCLCSQSRRRPVQRWSRGLIQVFHWPWMCQACPLSSAAWALPLPNSLRYQKPRQPLLHHPLQHPLRHPLHHASQQRDGCYEEDWEESHGMCVLVPQERLNSLHTLMKLPAFSHIQPEDVITLENPSRYAAFSFQLTTVDGSREDDISIDNVQGGTDVIQRDFSCFTKLLERKDCLVSFMYDSQFYCFCCPSTHLGVGGLIKSCQNHGLNRTELLLLPLSSVCLCSPLGPGEVLGDGDSEEEEKLGQMYERLRLELPNFFMTDHDYTMYSNDVEFINGLLNMKTRGLMGYRLTLSLWRFLSLCYYAEARLDVLKLTKHMEDGTIKARWRIKGLPFHSVLLRFYRKDKSHLYRSFDAFSTFYIGHDGLIRCHKVEKAA